MNELVLFLRMLDRTKIWHEVTGPSEHCAFKKATTMVRVVTGPDNPETEDWIRWNGYKGNSAYWYFDKDGNLIATGAFN